MRTSQVTVQAHEILDQNFQAQALKTIAASSRACGKTILVGEHAVVYGAAAIALPLPDHCINVDLTLTLPLKPYKLDQEFIVESAPQHRVPTQVFAVVRDSCRLLKIKPINIQIAIKGTLPIGAGLGGSAGLCVAILRALAEASQRILSAAEIAEMANILEKRFHGNPSGLDTAAIAHACPIFFTKGQKSQTLLLDPQHKPLKFLLLDSGTRSSTKVMIEIAKPYFTCPQRGDKRIDSFDTLSRQARTAIETNNHDELAMIINSVDRYLKEAGVSSSELSRLSEVCKKAGALAAKPTGAGGGGCLIILLPNEKTKDVVARIEKQLGPKQKTYLFELGLS